MKKLLMGNEAIAHGALEAGIAFATGYPGTPSTEVIETIARLRPEVFAEWAPNEKVALEEAAGVSYAGLRSLVTMKCVGLNVAADPLMSLAYSGVEGGLVILVADDPGPHTSQTEQDDRYYGKISLLPVLEPYDPQEAHDLIIYAYELSEKYKVPVIFRTTTRVNHTTADVEVGEFKELKREPKFKKDIERYVRASMEGNRRRHQWLNKTLKKIEEEFNSMPFNWIEGEGKIGIIVEGAPYNYVKEVIPSLGESFKILKLSTPHPLPRRLVLDFLRSVEEVIVIEEGAPFLEEEVKVVAYEEGLKVPIYGKRTGHLPLEGELNPRLVKNALLKILGREKEEVEIPQEVREAEALAPKRPPVMCPGCPHRGSYRALLDALRELGFGKFDVPVHGDIGCYALSLLPPLEAIWTEFVMGASISLANGQSIVMGKKIVATIGDSTFFHNGIQPLIDAVYKNLDVLVLILDNRTTAMTGHQPHPGTGGSETGRKFQEIDIEALVKAIGVKYVKTVDPYDLKATKEAIKEAMKVKGPAVIIAKRECVIPVIRRGEIGEIPVVIEGKCTGCKACILLTGCPALVYDPETRKVKIDSLICTGCGICNQTCPFDAIKFPSEIEKS
ncbi:indolepyruvate ferredoxin oxidoreductase subunit alpha [Thermococcus chitonophagus]|uniref:Indolepyruvate oxidoreductase subunit IorA n=1 Tax=Thermococcus chitonophagus TaxID=54262 RepID=A0A160VS23_9EURY|nr:indolepyruvate ferredoxin oxidoreductase subunit alpha [Thermococcus chitonophagus]ASJ17167.1 indolepyruvate ferredoxin oxidoreductase subunit alpha [Thermococcus chitonophagus]CUX77775.1 Indolepyruvate oxidoreductase subunit IorA [Thermococcus chitonophagus]